MRLARVLSVTFVAGAVAVLCVSGVTAARSTKAAGSPIVIGAAIDLTKNMAPFDAPALTAAQIEIKKINAAGGVDGHPLVLKFLNDQLDPQATKQDATKLISQGAQIGWVTCDVDYATPAVQQFLAAKLLTVAPCIGTDQMGPLADQLRRVLLGRLGVELVVQVLEHERVPVDASRGVDLLDLALGRSERRRVERRHVLRQVDRRSDHDRRPRRLRAPRSAGHACHAQHCHDAGDECDRKDSRESHSPSLGCCG